MVTLLSTLLSVPIVYTLFRNLDKNSLSIIRNQPLFIVPFIGLWLLLFFGSYIENSATSLLFILWPLVYLIYIFHPVHKIFRYLFTTTLGTFAGFVLLLYPLDLSVGFDAGRNLYEHMLSVLGFYLGLAAALTISFHTFSLSSKVVFLIGGLLGLIVEQNFLGPTLLISDPISFIIFAPTIFLTYGLYLLGPYSLFIHKNENLPQHTPRISAVIVFFICAILPLFSWLLLNYLLSILEISAEVLPI